jgi:hypothetical protein
MASFGDVSAAEIPDLAQALRFWRSSTVDEETPISTLLFAARTGRVGWREALPLVGQHYPASNASGGFRVGFWDAINTLCRKPLRKRYET